MKKKIKHESSLLLSVWGEAWQLPLFKQKLLLGLGFFILLLNVFPIFYQYIEKRNGMMNHDVFLHMIPAIDVSIPIFIVTWFMAVLMIIKAIKNPSVFMTFLYGFVILNIARFISACLMVAIRWLTSKAWTECSVGVRSKTTNPGNGEKLNRQHQ